LWRNLPWDWGNWGLSLNPSITAEFVEKHLDKPWDWGEYGLSSNPAITMSFVEKHLEKPWDWGKYGLSRNLFTYEIKREMNQAARIIQNGCHNLLWAPNHNGKPGLMVRKMLKTLEGMN
jgi:hypothetical protein